MMFSIKTTAREVLRFFKGHWVHMLLIVPGALFFTLIHEGCHAIAVVAQGGTLTHFSWLPSAGMWGQVRYRFSAGQVYSSFMISVAPYLLWTACCCLALLLSFRRRPYRHWLASTIFIWLFLAPLADIANAGIPYVFGSENDFAHAFGPPSAAIVLGLFVFAATAALAGFGVQKRLYGDRALGPASYATLGAAATLLILLVTTGL